MPPPCEGFPGGPWSPAPLHGQPASRQSCLLPRGNPAFTWRTCSPWLLPKKSGPPSPGETSQLPGAGSAPLCLCWWGREEALLPQAGVLDAAERGSARTAAGPSKAWTVRANCIQDAGFLRWFLGPRAPIIPPAMCISPRLSSETFCLVRNGCLASRSRGNFFSGPQPRRELRVQTPARRGNRGPQKQTKRMMASKAIH